MMKHLPMLVLSILMMSWAHGGQPVTEAGLSFDLRGEYERGMAEISEKKLDGKNQWAETESLVGFLVGSRATKEDRKLLVELILRDGDGAEPRDALFRRMRPDLIAALADDNEHQQVVRLLAGKCPSHGIGGPLCGFLHELRMEGRLPAGVGVLFEAYDAAQGASREAISELLRREFGWFFKGAHEAPKGGGIVAWCRAWYAENADAVLPNMETYISGPHDTQSAPVLVTIEDWLEDDMRRYDAAASTFYTSTWAEPRDFPDRVFLDEQRAWMLRMKEASVKCRGAVVQPRDGRENRFRIDRIVCDLEIECGEIKAVLPMRFQAMPQGLYFIGEDWRDTRINPWGEAKASVTVRCLPGRERVAARVGAIAASLLSAQEEQAGLQIKVYDEPAQLRMFVSPAAPRDMAAFSAPGQSVKIVAGEGTTDEEIRARLIEGLRLRDSGD